MTEYHKSTAIGFTVVCAPLILVAIVAGIRGEWTFAAIAVFIAIIMFGITIEEIRRFTNAAKHPARADNQTRLD